MSPRITTSLRFIIALCFLSCSSERDRFIGKREVHGTADLNAFFYQGTEWDWATPVSIALGNARDSVVRPKRYMFGTPDHIEDVTDLVPMCYDSILLVCYPYPRVIFIQDLSISGSKLESELMKRVQMHDGSLLYGR